MFCTSNKATILTTLAFAAASVTNADLGKKTAYSDGLSPHYKFGDELPAAEITSQQGIPVPQICIDYGKKTNGDGSAYCPGDQIARKVTYGDCKGDFIVCHCEGNDDQTQGIDNLIAQWGRVPPAFKENVRSILAYPSASRWAETFTGTGDILYFGNPSDDGMDVYIHEAGHALDQGNSSTQAWSDAVNGDSCVPDSYANTNLVEDFAQVGVVRTWFAFHGDKAPDDTDISCLSKQFGYWTGNKALNNAALTVKSCNAAIKGAHNPPSKKRSPSRGSGERRNDDKYGPSIVCDWSRTSS